MNKLFIILLTIMLPMLANAYDIEVPNGDGVTIYYNYINNGMELAVASGGGKYMGNIVIPEKVTYMNRTRNVTGIGYNAFYNCHSLTSVTIPNSVTSIGEFAFYDCSTLTSITIPNSVTSIGGYAFYDCYDLKKVIVSDIAAWCGIYFANKDANPLYIAGHLYSDENTEIKDLVIPNGVTSIGGSAFWNCLGLTSVTIPNSVTSIGEAAFSGCI